MNSLADRGFLYGDALFTTIKVQDFQLQLWPLHWQRLDESARRLGFAPLNRQLIEESMAEREFSATQVLKIQISRGSGGRGYSPAGIVQPHLYFTDAPLPDYSALQQQGVALELAQLQLGRQPVLAGMKHCNRLENVLLKQELEQRQAQELLVLDTAGLIVECTAANIFCLKQGHWYTPRLDQAGVAGVMRELLMRRLAVREVQWSLDDLFGVEAMLVCNALMGVVPVRQWQQTTLELAPVQAIQHQLPQWIQEFSIPCGKKP